MLLYALLTLLPAHAGAISDAQSAVLSNPESAEAWVQLGDAYRGAMKKKKARSAYHHASGLESDNLEVRARLAEVGQGRASRLERKAMRSLGDDEVWGDLGDEYMASGREADAEAAYRYALSLDPSDGEWQRKISELLGPEELIAQLEAGETTLSDEELGDYADVFAGQGETERACDLYQRAAQLDPEDNEWREKLINVCGIEPSYGVLGAYSEPEFGGLAMREYGGISLGEADSFSRTPRMPTGEAEALSLTAQAFALMGRNDEALAFFERALEFAPTDEKLRTAVLLQSDKTLVQVLERLVLRHPDEDELWGDLGDAYAAVGRKDDAAHAWGRAVELDPEDDEWSYKLGLVDPDRAAGEPSANSIRELLESK